MFRKVTGILVGSPSCSKTTKWRWGPVVGPEFPESAIVSPWTTASPSTTRALPLLGPWTALGEHRARATFVAATERDENQGESSHERAHRAPNSQR